MRLYNTLTRQEEDFAPAHDGTVRMYACGLTVYARGHIGNFRTFLAVDLLRRTLRHVAGFAVHHVTNFTDVDDKTISEAQKAGVPLREYTTRFIDAFREDAASLGLEAPEDTPRATNPENLQAMADMIAALESNGHTYRSDGSIYFKISTLPQYGQLAHLDHAGIRSGARVDSDKYEKEDARDFVLWKATKPDEPTWDCGVGPGRPGWHIECSAMALRLLGPAPIDIHCGGVDLIFPHHENEIAQAEGATGAQFSRFWYHVEHLLMDDGEKMSKSLGNVFTIRDILDQGYRASALRYLLISVHYRKQLKFSWATLQQAEEAVKRLMDCAGRLERLTTGSGADGWEARLETARADFREKLEADVNVPGALGAVFELLREANAAVDAGSLTRAQADATLAFFDECDRVLGVLALRRQEDAAPPIPQAELDALIAARVEARRMRNFAEADRIRTELDARGVVLEDGPGGNDLETQMSTLPQAPVFPTTLPGPNARAIIKRDGVVVSPSYTRGYPFVIARGEGAMVEDVDGNVFLDCAAGIAVNSTGHAHPEVVQAIVGQSQRYLHMSGTDFYYEPQVRLAEVLSAAAPMPGPCRSFFGNSGAEANEAAIKLARYHTKRPFLIAFMGSFHGRTLGALSLTASRAVQRKGFGPVTAPGVFHVPYPDVYRQGPGAVQESLDFLEDKTFVHLVAPDEVAAIVVEPIQGEGGYLVPPPEFLQRLREITTRHGILLIVDEVQAGMGRTGRLFAIEHAGVQPDIITMAKGIASGLPLGVATARAGIMDWTPGAHASTFGGNPVSCAAALTTIRLLQEQLVANAAEVGAFMLDGLRALQQKHALIGDVRGQGLMIGIELVKDRATKARATQERDRVVDEAFGRGLLVLGAGRNTIRLSPPLVLSREQAAIAIDILDQAIGTVSRQYGVSA